MAQLRGREMAIPLDQGVSRLAGRGVPHPAHTRTMRAKDNFNFHLCLDFHPSRRFIHRPSVIVVV